MVAAVSRRAFLAGPWAMRAHPEKSPLIETHLHLFARDQAQFPYHPNAPYRPQPAPLEDYVEFARKAGLDGAVIVHPEPYQDDHRYLEYCFQHEPSAGFFKGTCLFDPIDPQTPRRMEELARRNPGRIVALRIHATRRCSESPTRSGAIRDRDLTDPRTGECWAAAAKLGLAIQMHMIPCHASAVRRWAERYPRTPVILDHFARSASGTPAEFAEVLELGQLPNVFIKFSGLQYSSQQDFPYADTYSLVRLVFRSFGPERILWGGLGQTLEEFRRQQFLFEQAFRFASEADRQKIRGSNAWKLFWEQRG